MSALCHPAHKHTEQHIIHFGHGLTSYSFRIIMGNPPKLIFVETIIKHTNHKRAYVLFYALTLCIPEMGNVGHLWSELLNGKLTKRFGKLPKRLSRSFVDIMIR